MLFLGAGASKAASLPLTEELLERIYPRTGDGVWRSVHGPKQWARRLSAAIRVLYPAGDLAGFRPSVADFFTVLEVVAVVHSGRERLPLDAGQLLDELRTEVAHGLHHDLEHLPIAESPHAEWFGRDTLPDVVITSNWDTLIERAAQTEDVTVRLRWPRDANGRRRNVLSAGEIVLLKLHGSIDWGTYANRIVRDTPLLYYYSDLRTALDDDPRFGRARKADDLLLRFRSLEGARDDKGQLAGFYPPLMATMAVGKHAQIDALDQTWDDAYWCLSRAAQVDIIGYSFPDDDLELRTLLRTGSRQAGRAEIDRALKLTVYNPAPDAHDRARGFLGPRLSSNYEGAAGWSGYE